MPLFPDPGLTANIYCAGRLDLPVFLAVAPFWREFLPHDPERLCYLWLMRYGKGGEHLKVRIHGPESLRPVQRELLEKKVTALLDSLPEAAAARQEQARAPAIDAEDDDDHPDRTLLWTTYRRSHVSFGGKPFLADDRYAALFTRCLAAGFERMLALEPGPNGALPHPVRQSALLKALIAALAALGADQRADYLAYHRDWLLRSLLPEGCISEAEPLEQLRQRFDARIAGMGESLLPLRGAAEQAWNEAAAASPQDSGADWRPSVTDLLEYVSPLCRNPDYRLDPFASDPVFAPLFKVFHGFANQLGLRQADEAFAHHLLLRITAP